MRVVRGTVTALSASTCLLARAPVMAHTGKMEKSSSELIRIFVSMPFISLSLCLSAFSSLQEAGMKKPPPDLHSPSWKTVTKSKSSSVLLQDVKASVKGSSHMSLGVYSMNVCVYSCHTVNMWAISPVLYFTALIMFKLGDTCPFCCFSI